VLALAVAGLLQGSFALSSADAAAKSETGSEKKTRRELREERKQKEEEARKYGMSPRAAKAIGDAREYLTAEQYGKAEAALQRIRRTRLSPFEEAQVERLLGYIAYGQQKNADAIDHLGKAAALDALRPSDQADVLFQIAQIQGVEKRWKDVITTLNSWFATVEKPNSMGHYLMALSYYQLEDFDAAVRPAEQAVEMAKTPQQSWLQLLLAIQLTRKDYAAAAPVLAQLISHYPGIAKGYWLQLSALYGVSGDNARALAVMELAYRRGILDSHEDLLRLVQLNLLQGIPLRAAAILEKEIAAKHIKETPESFELLSGSWILAREVDKAEEPLARAAELAPKGDLYVRLAQVHMMQEEWSDAADALRKAMSKGGLGDTANAELLLGISYYNEAQLGEARTWFARAQRSNATRKQAEVWLEHVDRQVQAQRSQDRTPS
jgi:tetratricopeptide (TPR) repeat protein